MAIMKCSGTVTYEWTCAKCGEKTSSSHNVAAGQEIFIAEPPGNWTQLNMVGGCGYTIAVFCPAHLVYYRVADIVDIPSDPIKRAATIAQRWDELNAADRPADIARRILDKGKAKE